MKRVWLSFLFFLLLCSTADAQRKKVGLVLSGGGAKGVAHIGVLQVLEKAGIPVDIIVGTSMGSIVGGLYAIGYRADVLDSLVRRQNWEFLLSDKVYRYDLSFSEKEQDEKYLLSIPFDRSRKQGRSLGFVSGQNIYNLFQDLTIGYHDSLDFMKLPIPFTCIAADMITRKEIRLDRGNLALAMRASMAIPGAFTPVRMEDMVLVDGGVLNNFPVDVAKALGAEVIIGVDVQADLLGADELKSVSQVIPQIINLLCMNKYEANLKQTDLLIRPNVKGYTAASFSTKAIDSLLARGKIAALSKWDELMAFKEKIGIKPEKVESKVGKSRFVSPGYFRIRDFRVLGVSPKDEKWVRRKLYVRENSEISLRDLHRTIAVLYGTKAFSAVNYRLVGDPPYDLELTLKEHPVSRVNIGFRFDSEEMAAILLNTTWTNRALRGSRFSVTGRLSANPYVSLEYTLENTFLRRFNLAYMFRFSDVNVYKEGHKDYNMTFRYHMGEFGLSNFYFRNFQFQVGLRYEYFDYNSFLYSAGGEVMDVRPEGFFSYCGSARLETYDRRYYPTRGVSFRADYSLYTDNMITYKEHSPFSVLESRLEGVIPLTNRLKILPSVSGRVLIGRSPAYSYLNCMGGVHPGRYLPQQIAFLGINHMEMAEHSLIVWRLRLRQRMGGRHYASLIGNYAQQDDRFFDMWGRRGIWGGGVSYSRDSRLGPIDIVFSLSDRDKKLKFYFDLGFYF